jgi:hypothetical protein
LGSFFSSTFGFAVGIAVGAVLLIVVIIIIIVVIRRRQRSEEESIEIDTDLVSHFPSDTTFVPQASWSVSIDHDQFNPATLAGAKQFETNADEGLLSFTV